jgi:RimJ/RimL family protein N-acetyltransferase
MQTPLHPATAAPVLETERLKLRGHRLDDFAACAAMWADPAVSRQLGHKPFTEEESWTRLLRYVGHWALLGFGYWVVEEKASGAFAGEVGFADYKRDMQSPAKEAPEIGWVLSPRVHGKGYATEAARRAIAWGDEHFGSSRTTCIISPENLKSIRVAGKCGYRELQLTAYKGQPTMVFVREPRR